MKSLTIYTAIIIVLAAVALLAGCGSGHATAGVEQERGGGDGHMQTVVKAAPAPAAAPVRPVSSNAMAMVRRHSPKPGFVIRWPSKVIAVNSTDQFVMEGLGMLAGTGIRFAPGMPGGITYMGYSTERNSVGWSRYVYQRGRITSCQIWLNPRYVRRYSAARTFAHETIHCLGMDGHTENGLMHKYGKGRLTQTTKDWLRTLYNLPVGSRI